MDEEIIIKLLTQILANQERQERKLSMLMQEKKKATWVKASVIVDVTGWSKSKMQHARNLGYVKYKKENGGLVYDLDSIHPVQLKQQATA